MGNTRLSLIFRRQFSMSRGLTSIKLCADRSFFTGLERSYESFLGKSFKHGAEYRNVPSLLSPGLKSSPHHFYTMLFHNFNFLLFKISFRIFTMVTERNKCFTTTIVFFTCQCIATTTGTSFRGLVKRKRYSSIVI